MRWGGDPGSRSARRASRSGTGPARPPSCLESAAGAVSAPPTVDAIVLTRDERRAPPGVALSTGLPPSSLLRQSPRGQRCARCRRAVLRTLQRDRRRTLGGWLSGCRSRGRIRRLHSRDTCGGVLALGSSLDPQRDGCRALLSCTADNQDAAARGDYRGSAAGIPIRRRHSRKNLLANTVPAERLVAHCDRLPSSCRKDPACGLTRSKAVLPRPGFLRRRSGADHHRSRQNPPPVLRWNANARGVKRFRSPVCLRLQ